MSNQTLKHNNNAFLSPVSRSKGVDYSDDLVIESELVDFYNPGPSGEKSDFTIEKKPVETNRYHLNKVIAERAKGCSLKEVIATCERTGDMSILSSREVHYGDGTMTPKTLSDACDLATKGREYIESRSKEELELIAKVSKMDKSQFDSFVKELVDAHTAKPVEQVNEKGGV